MKFHIFFYLALISCSDYRHSSDACSFDTVTQKCVYTFVEKMPSYEDGNSDFIKDILKVLTFKNSSPNEIITQIKFQFVIDKHGKLIGARIEDKKDLNSYEIEFLEAIRSLDHKWNPGIHFGKKVPVLLTQTININLNEDN